MKKYSTLVMAALFILGVFVLIKVQFLTPTLWEADGYYHIRLAEIIRTQGILKEFHWAKYSFFATHFSDKDLLYHILLTPFTLVPNLYMGAKIAAVLFGVILLGTFLFLLRRYCDNRWIPVAFVCFFLSDHFLTAMSRPRPMVLAIAIMILGIHFILRRNLVGLFFATLIYGFMHITALLLVFFALLIEGMRIFERRDEGGASGPDFSLKPFLVSGLGLMISYLLHPNFPNNLLFIYLNLFLVPVYAAKGGILELGAEFFPMLTKDYLMSYPVLLPGILVLIFATMFRNEKIRFETKVFFVCSVPFLLGSFLSQRYILHGYPLLLIWLGSHFSELFRDSRETPPTQVSSGTQGGKKSSGLPVPGLLRRISDDRFIRGASVTGLVVCLIVSIGLTSQRVLLRARSNTFVNSHYEAVAAIFRKVVPPGDTIFHANWSDSQYFIGLNPQNDYFMTLDPIYMYEWNPKLYNLYRDIAHGRSSDPYVSLKETFKVSHGYAGKNYFSPFINQIRGDNRFTIIAEDPLGIIFKLKG